MTTTNPSFGATTRAAAIEALFDLGRNQSVHVHGVEVETMVELLRAGTLQELRREQGAGVADAYLVGKGEIDGVTVTLFSERAA